MVHASDPSSPPASPSSPPVPQPSPTVLPHPRPLVLKLLLTVVAGGAVWLAPTPPGLSAEGQHLLAVLAVTILLWMTETLPAALTALGALAGLAMALPGRPLSLLLAGFSSSVLYFYLGITVLGAAAVRSGLAERAATLLIRYAKGRPTLLLNQLVLSLVPTSLVMPSAITRNAMLVPAYESIFRRTDIAPGHPLATRLMLALAVVNPVVSAGFLTGGLAPVTTAAMLGGFTWLRWLSLMLVPLLAFLAVSTFALRLLYPVSEVPAAVAAETAAARATLPPLARAERYALLVMGVTSVLWLTDFWHGLNPAIPALIGAVAMLWPGAGVMTWQEFERSTSWSTFLVLGTVFSFTALLQATGTTVWLAGLLTPAMAPLATSGYLVILGVIVVCTLVHLLVPNIAATISLVIPVLSPLALTMGYNPMVLGLSTVMATNAIMFYPAQSVTGLQVYDPGWIRIADLVRVGLAMAVVVYLVTVLVAVPWWGLLGESLR